MFGLCNKCWVRHNPDSPICFQVSDHSDDQIKVLTAAEVSKSCPKCSVLHTKPGKFCSYACFNSRGPRTEQFKEKVRAKLKKKVNRTLVSYDCSHCGKNFWAANSSARKKRAFCSVSCSAASQRKYKLEKRIINPKTKKMEFFSRNCPSCQKEYIAKLRTQKCCSVSCNFKLKRQSKVENWLNGEKTIQGELIPGFVRKYLFEINNSKCQKCGWSQTNPTTGNIPLTVNHINGNPSDHRKENLELICPNCHSLTPNYGSLNKGKGRKEGRAIWRKNNKDSNNTEFNSRDDET